MQCGHYTILVVTNVIVAHEVESEITVVSYEYDNVIWINKTRSDIVFKFYIKNIYIQYTDLVFKGTIIQISINTKKVIVRNISCNIHSMKSKCNS
jgi:hypothetical protein